MPQIHICYSTQLFRAYEESITYTVNNVNGRSSFWTKSDSFSYSTTVKYVSKCICSHFPVFGCLLFAFCPSKFIWNTCMFKKVKRLFGKLSEEYDFWGIWIVSVFTQVDIIHTRSQSSPSLTRWTGDLSGRLCATGSALFTLRGELALPKSEWGNYLNHLGMN